MIETITSCAPVLAFSKPTRPPQSAPPTSPARMTSSKCTPTGRCQLKPTQAGQGGADDDLALRADVEQPGTERQRYAETGTDQRRCHGQRLGQREDHPREGRAVGIEDRPLEEGDVGLRCGCPGRAATCPAAGRRSSWTVLATSSFVSAIRMPPAINASTMASTDTRALPETIRCITVCCPRSSGAGSPPWPAPQAAAECHRRARRLLEPLLVAFDR